VSTTTWTESVPSNASAVGLFPYYARDIWGSIATGMGVEHFWPGAGGSVASIGELRPGASRAYVAAQSASSVPSQGTGRMFLASDVTRLFAYGSAATWLAGTPYFDEHASSASSSGYWGRQNGSFATTQTSGSTTITFPRAFLVAPQVVLSGSSAVWIVGSSGNPSVATFVSSWSALAATGASIVTFYWEALGVLSSVSST
jgi:hypothetical protein